jgi:hypothetical protein
MHRDRDALVAVMGATACLTVIVLLLMGFVAPAEHHTMDPRSTTTTALCATTTDPNAGTTEPCVTTTSDPNAGTTER